MGQGVAATSSSLQLSFAVFPLVQFTGERLKLGRFVNPPWPAGIASTVALAIAGLNSWLLFDTVRGWLTAH